MYINIRIYIYQVYGKLPEVIPLLIAKEELLSFAISPDEQLASSRWRLHFAIYSSEGF